MLVLYCHYKRSCNIDERRWPSSISSPFTILTFNRRYTICEQDTWTPFFAPITWTSTIWPWFMNLTLISRNVPAYKNTRDFGKLEYYRQTHDLRVQVAFCQLSIKSWSGLRYYCRYNSIYCKTSFARNVNRWLICWEGQLKLKEFNTRTVQKNKTAFQPKTDN